MTESVADVVREMKLCGDRDEAWERGMSDNSWPTRIEAAHAREVAEKDAAKAMVVEQMKHALRIETPAPGWYATQSDVMRWLALLEGTDAR